MRPAQVKLLDNLAYSYALQAGIGPSVKNGKAMKALWFLERLQTASPKNPILQLRIAEVYVYSEQWDNASHAYTKFINLYGNRELALTRLRALAIYHNWCETQEENLLKLTASFSQDAYAYHISGDACSANDSPDAAVRAYRKAFGLLSTSDMAIDLTWALFQQAEKIRNTDRQRALRDYEEIVRTFEQTPPEGPRAAQAYYMLAWSYWQMNEFAKSLMSYNQCVNANNLSNREAYFCAVHLGAAYSQWLPENERDFNKAVLYYQHAEKIAPHNINLFEVKLGEGRIWFQVGNFEKAFLLFQEAARLSPSCLECGLALGDTLTALGRVAEAREQYQNVLYRFPEDQRAMTALEKLEGQQ